MHHATNTIKLMQKISLNSRGKFEHKNYDQEANISEEEKLELSSRLLEAVPGLPGQRWI